MTYFSKQAAAAAIQSQRGAEAHLKKLLDQLGQGLAPVDLQQIQTRRDDSLQLLDQVQTIVENRTEALTKLGTFLQTYTSISNSLLTLQRSLEGPETGTTSQELAQLAQDVSSGEIQAVVVDNGLNRAYLNLHGVGGGDRTTCRELMDRLGSHLHQLQSRLKTRQSQAEVLEATRTSFSRRKELILRSLEELEERVRKTRVQEANVQNFTQR